MLESGDVLDGVSSDVDEGTIPNVSNVTGMGAKL